MTAKVRIEPSGSEFAVESGETLLEAALRSGIALNYHCNNGSCGDCKARIVTGEPAGELPHDYVIKESEKLAGFVLLCSVKTEQDLVIEASTADSPADIPVQRLSASVCKLERPQDDIVVLNLRTPRSQTLRFMAGQHARIQLNGQTPRNKSIASCPCNGMYLQFHIRKVVGDPFSDYVFSSLRTRDKVDVEGPFGGFTLDEASRRPIIYLAYETGFAPMKSLIEHAIALDLPQPMRLYWVGRDDDDHYFANYCRSWRDALDDFEFIPLSASSLSAHEYRDCERSLDVVALSGPERDMVCAAGAVVRDCPDLSGFDLYASGPATILDGAATLFARHGLPPERLFVDHIDKL